MTGQENTYAIIMAGGAGTRFWPLSRANRPKQLLPLGGTDESLLRATVRRIQPIVAPERVIVVTNAALGDAVREELPEVPAENVLAEPVGRNTAACIGWATSHVARRDREAMVMALAADHAIQNEAEFVRVLRRAVEAADVSEVVTLGIQPTRAETGYGYIQAGEPLSDGVFRAVRFVEKPTRDRAEEFVASRSFFWNSGTFIFRARTFLGAIRAHLPELGAALSEIDRAAAHGEEDEAVARIYPTLPSVSIDHGVMEKVEDVAVVPGDFGWSDVGSWTTAWELAAKDEAGNSVSGASVLVDAQRNFVRSPEGKFVALVGVEDLVVVDTGDTLLVCTRERAQEVRAVVDALKARGNTSLL